MVQCRVPAVIKSIPAGILQLSDPSPRYFHNIHTHTGGIRRLHPVHTSISDSRLIYLDL